MALVTDICQRSLRLIGIRDFTDADRQTEAIQALNSMLTSFRNELHHVPILDNFPLVAATNSYTIGTAGTINTARPIKILTAYIRDSGGSDHVVETDLSKEDYDAIYDKDAPGRPTKMYYDKANSTGLGTIFFNTAPSEAETCYISSLKPYTVYTALTDTFLLPTEYEEFVIFNLAARLAPEYFMEPSQFVYAEAQRLKEEIANENFDPVPDGEIPIELRR